MLAKRLIGKNIGRGAFGLAREVKKLEAEFGKSAVINSTIGTLFDDNENLLVLNTMERVYKELPPADIFGYAAGVSGSAEYKESVKKTVLGENFEYFKTNSYIDVAATPGGTGAIHNTLKAYGNDGETILLPIYMWEAYTHLASANGLKYDCYNLFKNEKFDIEDFSNKVINLAKEQKRVLAVINDPCQNPTGYSLSFKEWEKIINSLKIASEYGEVILLNDIAYIDYDFRGLSESRKYMKLFANLPKNILIVLAFSMSKAFTSYGLRTGAQLAISSDKAVIDDFSIAAEFLCRTSWSNTSRGGMALLSKIYDPNNIQLLEEINSYRNDWVKILNERANIFLEKAKEINLKICPFKGGFFITVPLEDSIQEIVSYLVSEKVFVLPLKNGIRIAICSVPANKLIILPSLLKKAIHNFKK